MKNQTFLETPLSCEVGEKESHLFSVDSLPTYLDEVAENYKLEKEKKFFYENYYSYAPFEYNLHIEHQPSFRKLKKTIISKKNIRLEKRNSIKQKNESRPLYATKRKSLF